MPSVTFLALITTAAATATHAALQENNTVHTVACNTARANLMQQTMIVDDESSWDSTPFDQDEQHKNLRRWDVESSTQDIPLPSELSNGPQIVVISEEAEIVIVLPDTTATYDPDFLQPQQAKSTVEPNKRQVTSTTDITSTATVAQPTTTVILSTSSQASTSTVTNVVSTSSVTQTSPTTITMTSKLYPEAQISYYEAQAATWRSTESYFHSLRVNDEDKHSTVAASQLSWITFLSRAAEETTSSEKAARTEYKSEESKWSAADTWAARQESSASKTASMYEASASSLRAGYTSVPVNAAVSMDVPFGTLTGSGFAAVVLLGLAIVL